MKKSTILIIILLLGSALVCGCTFPGSSGATPATTPPTITPVKTPVPPTPSLVVTSATPISTYMPLETIIKTEQTTRIATDNPYMERLQVTKRVFPQYVPNCPMQQIFPAIAGDTKYGIKQVVPKLSQISEHEYKDFLRDYTEGTGENQKVKDIAVCYGVDGEPNWNFVEVLIVLDPTNIKPSDYTISQNVRSEGDVIAQFKTTQSLVIDKQVILHSYIPVKTSEMDLFDGVDVTFTRLTS